MKAREKDKALENLVASALIALIGVVAASSIYLGNRAEILRERAALTELAASPNWVKAGDSRDPAFRRIYRLDLKGRRRYGAVLSVGSVAGREGLALLFSPAGELEAARSLGSTLRTSPFLRDDFLALFLGRGADKAFPSSAAELAKPEVASGATVSLSRASEALARLSLAIRTIDKE